MRFPAWWCFAILIFTLIDPTSQTVNPLSYSQNKKYVNSGTLAIDVTYVLSWNPFAVNVVYPFSFDRPVEGVFLTMHEMDIDNTNGGNVSFYGMVNSYTQTSFILHVYSNTSSRIKSLGYRYTAIAMKDESNFGWILGTAIQAVNISIPQSSTWSVYSIPVDLGGSYTLVFPSANQYAISILGYDIDYYVNQLQFTIKFTEGTFVNVSNLTAQIAIYKNYMFALKMSTVYFNFFIYNLSQDASRPYINTCYEGSLSYGYSLSIHPSSLIAINSHNYFALIMAFYTNVNETSFRFNYNFMKYGNLQVTVTSFYTYYCSDNTPYLKDDECYDVCPIGSEGSQASLTCVTTSSTNSSINSTSPTTDNSLKTGYQVGFILAYLSFVLLLALIVVIFYLEKKNKSQAKQLKYQSVNDVSKQDPPIKDQHLGTNDCFDISQLKPETELQLGGWRKKTISLSEECSMCLQKHTSIKTQCNHSFHVKCIVEWSDEYDSCPICRENITQKEHRVFCKICKLREKLMSFRYLKSKYRKNIRNQDFVCPSCSVEFF